MKKLLYFLLLLSSCTINHIVGYYSNNGADYKKSLKLNKDSTFTLAVEAFESKSGCQGKWKYLTKDTILLKCDSESFPALITSGYMSEREQKIIVLGKDRIKLKETILTRSSK